MTDEPESLEDAIDLLDNSAPPENLGRVIDLCRRQRYHDVADWLETFTEE